MRIISHVAYGERGFGTRWIIYRYEDNTTAKVVNGRVVARGTAADGPCWWRDTL